MDREQIINLVLQQHTIEKVANKLWTYFDSKEDKEDFIQEMYLTLCQITDDKLCDLYKQGRLLNYMASICIYLIVNKDSSYNKMMEHSINKISIDNLYGETKQD